MSSHRTLRHAVISALLLVAFLSQGTWALAGVTGNITGTVKDTTGVPVAGAIVQAVSPSTTRQATTDAGGHFVILSLPPDTYTISLSKAGYQGVSFPGVTVFADQTLTLAYTMSRALRTIAHVTSAAGASLVKSGVGSDLYSVNSQQAAAAAALGGGGNLNNAYSAMASVPGIQTSPGGMGWDFNAAYVRGQNSYYTGYEYDGIPVNRAFDNYNSSTESTLGLQELQVYTGGGPASVASAGTAGFINQVIKTGTFPGFATANLGIGTPQYYHQAQVEIGGSTPDRTFSYYVALSGYNQDYRFLDNTNGAGYMVPGGIFAGPAAVGFGIGYVCTTPNCQGVKPSCPVGGPPSNSTPGEGAGCWSYYSGLDAFPSQITDRENVVNLHMGIPKANGLRDDVQFLWSGSALNNYFLQSPNDIGTSYQQYFWALYHAPYAPPVCGENTIVPWANLQAQSCNFARTGAYQPYGDNIAYDVPFGTPIARSATSFKAPGIYFAPDTPPHDFAGPMPLFDNSINVVSNDTGITKLQYTYALSQSAYLRAYGYTFYSDWLETSPIFGATDEAVASVPTAQYQLMTHTAGGALDFQDQINPQNLLSLDGNYTTASVIRFNNTSAFASCLSGSGCSPIGYMAKSGSGYNCYDPTTGKKVVCLSSSYYNVATGSSVNPTWVSNAATGPSNWPNAFAPPGSAAANAGATWDSLWSGNATGSYNNVGPRFTNASIGDQWRPSDKWLVNASLRYDNFTYELPDSTGTADTFYANMTANYTCVYAPTNQVLTEPLPPGVPPPASAQYVVGDCNAAAAKLNPSGPHTGWVHPNGTVQDGVTAPNFTASSPSSYSLNYWEPRVSMTYTFSPDTVVRASAGRFTQPPISASVQYLSLTGDDRSVWNNTMNLGFYSPFHPIPGISSAQYDLSLEQHLRGTDMSFKITPYYTWVNDWQQQTFIGAGFVTQVPVGVNRNYGVEFQFNKGDFSRNGLSGLFAFTYTNSKVMFQNEPLSTGGIIPNTTIALNQAISAYNLLTKAGGGSACYRAAKPVSCTAKPITISGVTYDVIANPYYNQPAQNPIDPNGWYNPYSTAIAPNLNGGNTSYISPLTSSLILNYRQNKLAITPSFVFQSGGFYGSPLDITGVDPRACTLNSAATGITKASPKTNPLQCNYLYADALGTGSFGYLYIPNPQSGTFAFSSYENPSLIVGNLQVSYDLSPRIKLSVLGANLFHTCFGGSSEPWTQANPPGAAVCGYGAAGGPLNTTVYPSNFYNGTSINDFAANKVHPLYTQSYLPVSGNNAAIGAAPPPINVYFNAQVRI
jgi:Carboxypeptidase regulatory-like domain/TonB dependent receptor/TonB-dependent Receptor Plug Domain